MTPEDALRDVFCPLGHETSVVAYENGRARLRCDVCHKLYDAVWMYYTASEQAAWEIRGETPVPNVVEYWSKSLILQKMGEEGRDVPYRQAEITVDISFRVLELARYYGRLRQLPEVRGLRFDVGFGLWCAFAKSENVLSLKPTLEESLRWLIDTLKEEVATLEQEAEDADNLALAERDARRFGKEQNLSLRYWNELEALLSFMRDGMWNAAYKNLESFIAAEKQRMEQSE